MNLKSLKTDIINNINNNKYFEELELVRLAQDPNISYKDKIENLSKIFDNIVLINAKLALIEQYFSEPAPQNTETNNE